MHDTRPDLTTIEHRLAKVEPAWRRARTAERRSLALYGLLGLTHLVVLAAGVYVAIWVTGLYLSPLPIALLVAGLVASGVVTWRAVRMARVVHGLASRHASAYARAFADDVVLPSVREVVAGCTVTAESGIDVSTFDASELFIQPHDVFEGCCGISGEADGVLWRASTLHVRRHKDTRHGRQMTTTFAGMFVHLDLPLPPPTLRVFDQRLVGGDGRYAPRLGSRLVQAGTGDAAFDHAFHLLPVRLGDMLSVPDAVRRTCVDVLETIERPILLSFNRAGVFVAVVRDTKRSAFEPDTLHATTASDLADELDLVGRLPAVAALVARRLRGPENGDS